MSEQQHMHGESLAEDLDRLLRSGTDRRTSLRWLLAGAAALPIAGCGGGSGTAEAATTSGSSSSSGSTGTIDSTNSACKVIPSETEGPYPGDGTNSNGSGIANALILSGIVRSDIRSSIAGATAVAAGIPLTIRLKIVNVSSSCATATGAAVYLWHCDRAGNYSMYSTGVTGENYLRGVQQVDADGYVTFTTIFPGCYAGRIPHVHFEVYPSLAKATSAANRVKTSQFTFPMAPMNEVYATTGYEASARNLTGISYASDGIFSDGYSLQMPSVTGSTAAGYTATLVVGVDL